MGLRSVARALHRLQLQRSGVWEPSQPLNSQQHIAQKYLNRLLSRLCPGTPRHGSGACAGTAGTCSSSGRAALEQQGAAAAAAWRSGSSGGGSSRFSTFTPTRLYPKAMRFTAEDAVFWGIIATNVAVAAAARAPDAREFALQHLRTSVEAVSSGRLHTLVTSVVSHYSAIHCAINLGMLALFRRAPHPLSAAQLLTLYFLGGVAGAAGHVAWHWYDAGGPRFGLQYALNTPAFFGASGGVAAVTAYKAAMEPAAMRMVVIIPVPILFALLLYCALEVKEPEYCDGYPAKLSGAAVGALLAAAALITRGRAPRPPPRG